MNSILLENSEFNAGRENMYRFLAMIYKTEITEDVYQNLKSLDFTVLKEESEGYGLLEKYFQKAWLDPLTDLAVDYARIFLGAGVVEKSKSACPYESVYTSDERLIMQEARDEVLAVYRSHGLQLSPDFKVPEDHITIELEFMAYLCREGERALQAGDKPAFEKLVEAQISFLTTHLQRWIPQFCKDVGQYGSTDFYRGIARITADFLTEELALADSLQPAV